MTYGQGQPRVLAVDDDPEMRNALCRMLRRADYAVSGASGGVEALKLAKEQRPDVIVLDVRMPGCDGYEVCRQLKLDPELRTVPVIFVSALVEPLDKTHAFSAGAADFLTKPFDQAELLARVQVHLRARRLELELARRAQASERYFRDTFERAAVGIAHVAPDGRFLRVNPRFCQILDHDEAELLEQTVHDVTYPGDPTGDSSLVGAVSDGERASATLEKRVVRKDGTAVWVDVTVAASSGDEEEGPYLIAVVHDITERRRAAAKQRLTQFAVDHAAEAVFRVGLNAHILYANEATRWLIGYPGEQLIGMAVTDLVAGEDQDAQWQRVLETANAGSSVHAELMLKRQDGQQVPVELSVSRIEIEGDEHDWVFARDVTERKRIEAELSKHREALEDLVRQRTADLEVANESLRAQKADLEVFNRSMVDREMKIIELKEEVNALSEKLGRGIVYPPVWNQGAKEGGAE